MTQNDSYDSYGHSLLRPAGGLIVQVWRVHAGRVYRYSPPNNTASTIPYQIDVLIRWTLFSPAGT